MNISNTPKTRNIVPFFLLSGLLAITAGCSSSEPRPVAVEEPVEPAPVVKVEEKEIQQVQEYRQFGGGKPGSVFKHFKDHSR